MLVPLLVQLSEIDEGGVAAFLGPPRGWVVRDEGGGDVDRFAKVYLRNGELFELHQEESKVAQGAGQPVPVPQIVRIGIA
jgi:hypothetical protein